jgi:hypothetical protein
MNSAKSQISPARRMIRMGVIGLIALSASVCLHAQTAPTASDLRRTMKREAYAAFKQGDTTIGLNKLSTLLNDAPRAGHRDLQLGRHLADISCWLRNEGNSSRARETANLAATRLAQPQSRMTARDAGVALLIAGQLAEHVQGDSEAARRAYRDALVVDPSLAAARDRLAHLDAIAGVAEAKTAANNALLERARNSKR